MAASRVPSDCWQRASALVRFIPKLQVDSVLPTRVLCYHWSESRGDPWKSVDVSFQVISALSIRQFGADERGFYSGYGWVVRDSNLGKGKDYSLLKKKMHCHGVPGVPTPAVNVTGT